MRRAVVLGLREKVGGDPVGVVVGVRDHQHLGGAGDHVDADGPEDLALGARDIGVAGADDLGDRRDRRRAVGEGGHRLRAADAIDLVDARDPRGGEHQGVQRAAHCRHHHGDARDARDLGGHRVHQDRGGIARRPARHIEADRFHRRPAAAEHGADLVLVTVVLRTLPLVMAGDAAVGER